MAVVDFTIYKHLAVDDAGRTIPVGAEPAPTVQISTPSASSQQTSAFGDGARFVRVHTDVAIRIEFGPNPTAAGTSKRMAAGQTEYFGVRPSDKAAVVSTT